MTTQLQAQRVISAHLLVDIPVIAPAVDLAIPAGAAVTCLWERSYLVGSAHFATVMHHQYRVYGFDRRGKYREGVALLDQLRDVVCVNFDISTKSR